MKRILVIVLTVLMLTSTQVGAMGIGIMPISGGIEESIQLHINDEEIIFSSYAKEPYEKDGTFMLPLRSIAENLGFEVSWNNEDKSIEITRDAVYTKLYIGLDNYFYGEVTSFPLGIAPEIKESRTFVPYTFFEKVLFTDVEIEGNIINIDGYVDYQFDLENDVDFNDIVADVPTNFMVNDFYSYTFNIVESPLENMGKAIYMTGDNHSDDMFMGFYKKIIGLEANQQYIFKLSFDLGTNVPGGMVGIGGSPGSSVYVKAGIVSSEPSIIVRDNYYRLDDIDKANQSQSGKDLKVVTDMIKGSNDSSKSYEYKKVMQYFIATTNANGEVYIMIGTDSGFEGITEVYYDNIKLSVREATEYNVSTIQEANYQLESQKRVLDNGVIVYKPNAINFIDFKKEEKLNAMIENKFETIVNKEAIESLNYSYSKKDNGLLSIIFSGNYSIEGGSYSFYEVLNINTTEMEEILTVDFVKKDETSLNTLNILLSEKLQVKGKNKEIKFNNSMNVFYEQGMYIITFLAKDSDTRDTMIIFNESEASDLFNY